jgi:four helix bundle protein
LAYTVYEDLDVYIKARALALHIHQFSQQWPKNEQYGGLADQLRRASKSINANLAEGLARNTSVADKSRFIQIAMGSCQECRVWLDFAQALHYSPEINFTELREEYNHISRMLYKLQQSIKKA